VSDVVVLDSTPLGLITNPNHSGTPVAIRQWIADLLAAGRRVILPEIADYEVRREYLRASLTESLVLLNSLATQIEYLPLNTSMIHRAAEFWAQARNAGKPTSPPHALDGDVILAAQALSLGVSIVVATSNPSHLSRFVPTADWQNIVP
jgi:predicted nucleic acid-binding protein